MQATYPTISLKLFSEGITSLHNRNWVESYLYEKIDGHVNGTQSTELIYLLRKPLEKGLAYNLGIWIFEDYFSKKNIEYLYGESRLFFLNDLYELMQFHDFEPTECLSKLKNELNKYEALYKEDIEEYCDLIDTDKGNTPLCSGQVFLATDLEQFAQ